MRIRITRSSQGFTLIEAIVTIVVMAVSITTFAALIMNVTSKNTYAVAVVTAAELAEAKMDEVLGRRFANGVVDEGPVAFPAPFSAYAYQVAADYVAYNNLNGTATGSGNYKRVTVTVTHGVAGKITLTSLVTNGS